MHSWQTEGVNAALVQKIDEKFLESGTREEFRAVILELLNLFQTMSERIGAQDRRILELENELRRLKGEKKSPTSGRLLIEKLPRYGRG